MNPIPPTRETQGVRPIPQIASDPVEESEDDMSSLAVGFSMLMSNRARSAQGETTSSFEVPGRKRPKRSDLDEDVR